MKRILLVMGLALGLCPLLAAAQHAAAGGVSGVADLTIDVGSAPFNQDFLQEDREFSPSGVLPSTDWVNVLGYDFRPYFSTTHLATTGSSSSVWCTAGGGTAVARLNLPHDRKIKYFRVWGFDSQEPGDDFTVFLKETCLPSGGATLTPTNTILATLDSAGATPSSSFTRDVTLSPQPVVDARQCTYWAQLQFDECSASSYLTVRKVFVEHTE